METAEIRPGSQVVAVDIDGNEHPVRALSTVETDGHTFPVVWIERPLSNGGSDRVPWPAESIKAIESSTATGG
jgi:hypothetical protein